jgi:hypothetical protein
MDVLEMPSSCLARLVDFYGLWLKATSTTCLFYSVQMDLGLPGLAKSLTEPVTSKCLIRLATVSRFIDSESAIEKCSTSHYYFPFCKMSSQ